MRSDQLIQNTDFVPTWFELAQSKTPDGYHIDGVSLRPLFQKPDTSVREYVYHEIGAARSIKTRDHSYISLRYTREQVSGVRDNSRRHIKSMTGLSGGVSRSIATHPHAYTGDQLYDLKNDPNAQKNLASLKRHAKTLKRMQDLLIRELGQFPQRPYGEFYTGGNSIAGGSYNDVFKTLRTAAADKKKKSKVKWNLYS